MISEGFWKSTTILIEYARFSFLHLILAKHSKREFSLKLLLYNLFFLRSKRLRSVKHKMRILTIVKIFP